VFGAVDPHATCGCPTTTSSTSIDDAEDRVIFVDPGLIEKVEANADELDTVEQYVVLDDEVPETSLEPVTDYESLLKGQPAEYEWPDIDEDAEYGMCHTSGTTGCPRASPTPTGRCTSTASWAVTPTPTRSASATPCSPVVPMFHANGWGIPYGATLVGPNRSSPRSTPIRSRSRA